MHVVGCLPISLLTCTADQVVRSHPSLVQPSLVTFADDGY
jgi:hypothetical protein